MHWEPTVRAGKKLALSLISGTWTLRLPTRAIKLKGLAIVRERPCRCDVNSQLSLVLCDLFGCVSIFRF